MSRMNTVGWVRAQGGAVRRRDLDLAGVSPRRLRMLLETGRLERYHRGCYSLPGVRDELRAAVLFRAQVACVSALLLAGVPLLERPMVPHLSVPRDRSLARPGIRPVGDAVIHHWDGDCELVAHVSRALDDAAGCLPPLAHLCAVDGALNKGLIAPTELEFLGGRSQVRGAWLRRHAEATAESPPETLARYALRRAGLPVRAQVRLADGARRDLLVADAVVVEIDGYESHRSRQAFVRDRQNDRITRELGYVPLRFAASEVLRHPGVVVPPVQRALTERSARRK